MDFPENTLKLLGNIGITATITIVVCWIFIKLFGEKIFQNQLDRSLESFRFRTNLEFDRISKINQKEFEILPELWRQNINIRQILLFYMSDQNRTLIDFKKLTDESLEAFIRDIPLPEWAKTYLRTATNKEQAYNESILLNGRQILNEMYTEMTFNFRANKIFLTEQILEKLSEIDKFYHQAIGIFIDIANEPKTRELAYNDMERTSRRLLDELAPLLRARLRVKD